MPKAPKLDKATEEIARRLLASPPKPLEGMKANERPEKKNEAPKGPASSSKRPRA
jgi:hypothetical protein